MKRSIGLEMKQVVIQMSALAERARLLQNASQPCQPHDPPSHTPLACLLLVYVRKSLRSKVRSVRTLFELTSCCFEGLSLALELQHHSRSRVAGPTLREKVG